MIRYLSDVADALVLLRVFVPGPGRVEIDGTTLRVFGPARPADMPFHVHARLGVVGWRWVVETPRTRWTAAHWCLAFAPDEDAQDVGA